MSHLPHPSIPRSPPPRSLYKLNSWSPDSNRDEAWLRRKVCRNRRSKSLTDEDLDELKACIELGFTFDSSEIDQRLSDTIPAYGLYYAINKNYNSTVAKQQQQQPSSSAQPECDTPSPVGSPHTILGPTPAGDNPQVMKTRLRQWAQLVACSVRQSPN
ncbi:uncharacterized protein [Primulina eburnea]|uniref:uncharacterized protein isoform X2 n=1 Tax=Primulina eburnea TaxID=1245227 RepID=UPI003C6C8AD7